ncbi:MAG: SigE family RNA polymerase sigma factor [Nocardioides sp.]|nr:SigE family RNA polymerase sigma factor [Nocardioides sp.]
MTRRETRAAQADFEDFVRARTPALSRTAYLLTGDAHLAEDLVQTALFKAARAWHRIDGDPEPYVRRTMYHQNVSWWRRRRHVTEHGLGSYDAPHRADEVAAADLRVPLREALDRLTPRQRSVVVLRYVEDLTERETADALGIRPGSVKSIAREALAKLRTTSPGLADLAGGGAR